MWAIHLTWAQANGAPMAPHPVPLCPLRAHPPEATASACATSKVETGRAGPKALVSANQSRGGWPSGRILVHFRVFEPKPRCRGTRAAFGLHAVLATCPVFAFGTRNPLFLGLELAVGISVALQVGPCCHQLLHADGGDARSRGAQFSSGSPMGCIWRLMSARGGSRGCCCRVLACFPD